MQSLGTSLKILLSKPNFPTSSTQVLTLPKAVLAAAQKVPNFQEKLEQFVRTEIALHTFREDRYQPKARHILEKAKQKVEEKQLAENDRADAVNAFLKNYQSMMADL